MNEKFANEKRKCLLLLDNAPVHPNIFDLSNIELLFLPKNSTSKSQPLDQGVIRLFKRYFFCRSFKSIYRKYLLREIFFEVENDENFGNKVSECYSDLIIINCFCRSEENIINNKIKFNISSEVQKSQIDDEDSDIIYHYKDYDKNKKKNEY